MFVNGNSILYSVMGVFTLIVILFIQVVPPTDFHFRIEISKALDLEDAEGDEKAGEEKFEEKYTQDSNNYFLSSLNTKSADFYFLHLIPASPSMETISPPPDSI
jgi:hypothetical protein